MSAGLAPVLDVPVPLAPEALSSTLLPPDVLSPAELLSVRSAPAPPAERTKRGLPRRAKARSRPKSPSRPTAPRASAAAGSGTAPPAHSIPSFAPSRVPGRAPARRITVLAAAGAMVMVLVGIWIGVGRWTSQRDEPIVRTQGSTSPDVIASAVPSTPDVATTPMSAAYASKVKLGVFRGTSLAQVKAFQTWLGRDVDYVVDFSARDTWDQIANPDYMIREWAGSGKRVVYSTGLLPSNGASTIARGAKGAYDQNYTTLARNLVAAGEDQAIIRLGWEFNLPTSPWSTASPTDFVSYWRHVVTAMRAVPGQHFAFDWNPNVGDTQFDATQYYPGNAYVDYVGVDVYDVSWQTGVYPIPTSCTGACKLDRQKLAWDALYNGEHGLGFWAQFARNKHKPMSLPEWGVWKRNDNHGGGDDPYFIDQMYRFIANPENNVAYQAYFETNTTTGEHRLMTTMTEAGKTYLKRFGD